MFDFFMAVADTNPFGIQADVTLKTNFFATRDICNVFLPIIKPGGESCLLYLAEPACLVILVFSFLPQTLIYLSRSDGECLQRNGLGGFKPLQSRTPGPFPKR